MFLPAKMKMSGKAFCLPLKSTILNSTAQNDQRNIYCFSLLGQIYLEGLELSVHLLFKAKEIRRIRVKNLDLGHLDSMFALGSAYAFFKGSDPNQAANKKIGITNLVFKNIQLCV